MLAVVTIYTVVVAIIVAFIAMTLLVSHNVIFKYSDNRIKRFFARPMLSYSIRRIGSALISLSLAIIATFFLLRIEDPRVIYCNGKWIKYSEDIRQFLCDLRLHRLGVDQPILVQLLIYFYNIIPFPKLVCDAEIEQLVDNMYQLSCFRSHWTVVNFGTSDALANGKLISTLFMETMPWSLWIGLGGVVIQIVIGYPLGVFMAKYKNRLVDRLGNAYIILVGSIPGLVYYYILQVLFCIIMGLPYLWAEDNIISWIPQMLTLGLGGVAGIALWVRRYMVDEFGADYVKFARAKGVPENTILFKHVLRNAAVPLVRSIPASVLYCLLGSYFVEQIYGVEGFGRLLIQGINRNDYPLVQAIVVVSAIISIIANLIGDITTAIADPRVSFTAKK